MTLAQRRKYYEQGWQAAMEASQTHFNNWFEDAWDEKDWLEAIAGYKAWLTQAIAEGKGITHD